MCWVSRSKAVVALDSVSKRSWVRGLSAGAEGLACIPLSEAAIDLVRKKPGRRSIGFLTEIREGRFARSTFGDTEGRSTKTAFATASGFSSPVQKKEKA